ncbi:MAG: hypothetical protein ACYTGF_12310 [Planctomycetota bacterium]
MRHLWVRPAMVGSLGLAVATAAVSSPDDPDDPYLSQPELLTTAWLSLEVRQEAIADGWEPIPLMTDRFHYDAEEDAFDGRQYADRIWWPEWATQEFVPGTFEPAGRNWEKLGIPGDDSPSVYAGWADLDFERYAPIWHPEEHDPEEVSRIAQSYLNLAWTTRELRPNARIILHGLVNQTGSDTGRAIIEQIVGHYDAISPSIYPRFTEGFTNLDPQLNQFRQRLEFCVELRAAHGVKIMPIIWKRYEPLDHGEINPQTGLPWRIVMPPDVARAVLEMLVEFDLDGVIVFGPDGRNHWRVEPNWPPDTPAPQDADDTTRRWLKMIKEVIGG